MAVDPNQSSEVKSGFVESTTLHCLRILLHLGAGPASAIPLIAIDLIFPDSDLILLLPAFAGAILLVIGFGVFDGVLSTNVSKENGKPIPAALRRHVFRFFFVQLFLGPPCAFIAFCIVMFAFTEFF